MQNKRGFIDFEDLNIIAIVFGIIAAFIGLIIADKMGSGLLIKLIAMVINFVVAYIIGVKLSDS